MKEYLYSEIFNSVQGEGHYTGVPTGWLRFFLCNLQCNGFGQDEPTNPDSWELPYEKIDLKDITKVEDLPVFEKGCDSSYTWAKKFKPLMKKGTPKEIAERIRAELVTDTNPTGTFKHPLSGQISHMCFTGGEPLMPTSQECIIEVMQEFKIQKGPDVQWGDKTLSGAGNVPSSVTFETNGTKPLSDDFVNFWTNRGRNNVPCFFSVSPKLWTVAGEKAKRAIQPDVIKQYFEVASHQARQNQMKLPTGQLKFVMGPHKEQWEEMESVVAKLRELGVYWPVWVMPVGARVEEQELSAGDIAKIAFERGYNVSARVHTYLFGNAIGT